MKNSFLKPIAFALVVGIFLLIAIASDSTKDKSSRSETVINDNTSSASVETIEGTKSCLVDYDWVYPSSSNPTGAWKFSSDGTFNSSTTMFGGMSTWGNWTVINPGQIKISYTRTTEIGRAHV